MLQIGVFSLPTNIFINLVGNHLFEIIDNIVDTKNRLSLLPLCRNKAWELHNTSLK